MYNSDGQLWCETNEYKRSFIRWSATFLPTYNHMSSQCTVSGIYHSVVITRQGNCTERVNCSVTDATLGWHEELTIPVTWPSLRQLTILLKVLCLKQRLLGSPLAGWHMLGDKTGHSLPPAHTQTKSISKVKCYLLLLENITFAKFRPTSTVFDHSLVNCDLTQILALQSLITH